MPFIASENFYCNELNRLVRVGEMIELTDAEAKAYQGMVRRTTQGRIRKTRMTKV